MRPTIVKQEGVIGVVGVAPWSTLDFCKTLYGMVTATKDWHYPRVLVDINTKIPSRGRHFELGEEDFSFAIEQSIRRLADAGANVVVVTCNTAHIYYARWANCPPVPVPHIAQACVDEMARKQAQLVAILGGASLRSSGLYENLLAAGGIAVARLSETEADLVAQAIEQVKTTSRISESMLADLAELFRSLRKRGVDGLILGCTELSSALPLAADLFPNVVESNAALAAAALTIAMPDGLNTANGHIGP
ncbi:aspartate/glutamate racemase family protein [Frateuria sp. MAH-13]|uniref:Aspartate/glutamate racemase family protein n=1 Tax=Frateuria flava TaxID=2821489 RepID=A0ABS4DNP2_9GAMM|nr:amino acid racemase [Frateuria flava]MBP1474674.1 aspartate/glutamate racemase family protein [Frateuria flava]